MISHYFYDENDEIHANFIGLEPIDLYQQSQIYYYQVMNLILQLKHGQNLIQTIESTSSVEPSALSYRAPDLTDREKEFFLFLDVDCYYFLHFLFYSTQAKQVTPCLYTTLSSEKESCNLKVNFKENQDELFSEEP